MNDQAVSAVSTDSVTQRTRCSRVRLPVIRAEGGDHSAIFCFLQTVLQGPSRAEFNTALADPFYEPFDRLLLRRERQIVAHVHTTHRVMHFGPVQVPVEGLGWLGVASEHRNQGLGTYLLRAAESQMQIGGALLGMLRTSAPRFFRRTGWAMCGQASYRRADARTVLARLLDRGLAARPRRRLHIRPWLQWEQAALMRIYSQNVMPAVADEASDVPQQWRSVLRLRLRGITSDRLRDVSPGVLSVGSTCPFGPLERTEAYWHWLLKRHAYDQIYVALEGPELLELGEISTHVVGYAVARGEQILELMTAPDRPRVAAELLARCCGDAIEHDRHCVLLHAPPCCPLFEIFDEAGGCGPPPPSEHGQVHMMRLLDPPKLLRQLSGEFERRVAQAHLPREFDLGLLVDGQKYQLEFGRDGVGVTSSRVGRSYLRLNVADFTRLVLGQFDWKAAIADDRLECSTALAGEAGRVLFPSLPLWRPPWDDLPALDDWDTAK